MSASDPAPRPRRWAETAAVVAILLAVAVVAPQLAESKRQFLAILISIIGILILFLDTFSSSPGAIFRIGLRGFAAIGVAFVVLTNLPVAGLLCRPLLLPPSTERADAIFVLASGVSEEGEYTYAGLQRVMHGATLLKEGRAPRLFLSTGDPTPDRPIPEAGWTASFAAHLGLASGAFEILTGGITTTRTEARNAARLLLPRGFRRILLVTNGPHIRRAAATFRAAGFEVLPAPVQTARTVRNACDSDLGLFRYAMHEWLGLVLYWLRGDFSPAG
ncbi:MAG TPA: YdcF family protein [Candidatus Ozemobacteraceae bacterium]|nr:YdcF family protein [Candidatus Ozemobacteraceae bacterium]